MKARNISGQAPGGKRTRLAEVLPLKTPFVIQIFPVYACNFRCNYCIFSVDKAKRHFISDKIMMDYDLYEKCVEDISVFPDKLKVLRFVGIGEPLLHKRLPDMVRCAVDKDVANVVEILTNASLLTPKLSDSLLSAGLTRLVVSLQGTTGERYREVSGVDVEFEKFVQNLRYFFENKGRVQMYVKIVDSSLRGKDDEERFYRIFGDICDTMAVEHTVPIHSGVEYGNILGAEDPPLTQFGLPVKEVQICPQPFFTLQINPDGKVVPCYSFEYPEIMGDCNHQSVPEIWNGAKFRHFRRTMLDGIKSVCGVCSNCSIIKYRLFPEDVLNDDAERLKDLYTS